MKQRPILYSPEMARAKIALMKTQTRRMSGLGEINENPDNWLYVGVCYPENRKEQVSFLIVNQKSGRHLKINCPYGQPRDILWGRENWRGIEQDFGPDRYEYQSTEKISAFDKWKPSLHMPLAAARIWDEVISILPERIADISEEDCIAEGVECVGYEAFIGQGGTYLYRNYLNKNEGCWTARESFRSLWQSLYGKPDPVKTKVDGKTRTIAYQVFPFDEEEAMKWTGVTSYRGKPLTVITNPWVWRIETKQLSVTGRPTGI